MSSDFDELGGVFLGILGGLMVAGTAVALSETPTRYRPLPPIPPLPPLPPLRPLTTYGRRLREKEYLQDRRRELEQELAEVKHRGLLARWDDAHSLVRHYRDREREIARELDKLEDELRYL